MKRLYCFRLSTFQERKWCHLQKLMYDSCIIKRIHLFNCEFFFWLLGINYTPISKIKKYVEAV